MSEHPHERVGVQLWVPPIHEKFTRSRRSTGQYQIFVWALLEGLQLGGTGGGHLGQQTGDYHLANEHQISRNQESHCRKVNNI